MTVLCHESVITFLLHIRIYIGVIHLRFTPFMVGMGKTGREAGVGVGDQWVKPGEGNCEIT